MVKAACWQLHEVTRAKSMNGNAPVDERRIIKFLPPAGFENVGENPLLDIFTFASPNETSGNKIDCLGVLD